MNSTHLQLFKETPGAISVHEFFSIQWLASKAPENGVCLCLGSNAGKAAIAQATGLAAQGKPRGMFLIDTVFDLNNKEAWSENVQQPDPMATGWSWIYEPYFHDKVIDRVTKAGDGLITPYLIGESALRAIPKYGRPGIAFAFSDVDSHNGHGVKAIAGQLAEKMIPGGIIAWHDFRSQFGGVEEASDMLIETGAFEEIEIPWATIQRIVDENGGEHEGNESWHHRETPRPMFVGAVRRL